MSDQPKLSVWDPEPAEPKVAEGREAYKKHVAHLVPDAVDGSENPDKSDIYEYARLYKGNQQPQLVGCEMSGAQGWETICSRQASSSGRSGHMKTL